MFTANFFILFFPKTPTNKHKHTAKQTAKHQELINVSRCSSWRVPVVPSFRNPWGNPGNPRARPSWESCRPWPMTSLRTCRKSWRKRKPTRTWDGYWLDHFKPFKDHGNIWESWVQTCLKWKLRSMSKYGNYCQWNAWNANGMPCMSLRFWAQRHQCLIANSLTGGYGTGCGSIMFNHVF